MKTLIVIPTYNELDNIATLIKGLSTLPVDLLFVDDGSPDGTAELIKSYEAQSETIHLLARDAKLGLASAYLAGFQWAINHDYEAVAQMDADLSHQPQYLSAMLAKLTDHDLVIGSRYVGGGAVTNWPWFRKILSQGGSLYARLILNLPIKDLTGGFNLWRVNLLTQMDLSAIKSDGYCFQIEMKQRALVAGAKFCEAPIIFVERINGKSKLDKKIIVEAVWRVWSLSRYKKFIKFSLVGATGLTMDIGLMVTLVEIFHWQPLNASYVSFVVSVSNNFIWNKQWTFRDQRPNFWKQYGQFLATATVGLGINYIMMVWLLAWQVNYVLARLLAVAVIVIWNFIINSHWTFREMK